MFTDEEVFAALGRLYMTVVKQSQELEQVKRLLAEAENKEPDAD